MNFFGVLPWTVCYVVPPASEYTPAILYPNSSFPIDLYYQQLPEALPSWQVSFNQPIPSPDFMVDENPRHPRHQEHSSHDQHLRLRKRERNLTKKLTKKGRRKPDRNVLTNVANQVFTFAQNRRRSDGCLRRGFPILSEQQTDRYYAFAKEVKNSMHGYINFSKLSEVWLEGHPENELNYRIFRTLCYYYIREGLVPSILTSHKILSINKTYHLKMRSKLMEFFIAKSYVS